MSLKPTKKIKSEAQAKDNGATTGPNTAVATTGTVQSSTAKLDDPATSGDSAKPSGIEEAIEIALEAASTAVDSALEIQRIRSESFKLISETRKSSKLLLYSASLIFMLAAVAVFGSLVYFKRAMNDFDLITKVNRDALLVFTGEISGLVAIGKKLDENVKTSSQALDAITNAHADLTNRVQRLTAALAIATASIAKLETQEKQFTEIKQSLDELSSATRSANARAADLRLSQMRPVPITPVAKPRSKPRAQASTTTQPKRPAAVAPGNSMIRYP